MSRRMTRKRVKTYGYCKRLDSIRDAEGNRKAAYAEPEPIDAQIWFKLDELQIKMYGEKSSRILKMLYAGDIDIKKGDGICYKTTDKPDYKVVAAYPYEIGYYELEEI